MLKDSRVKLADTILELHAMVGVYAARRAKQIGDGNFKADDLGLDDFHAWASANDIHFQTARELRSRKGTRT